jgi:DNA-binding IclR family transcriptional regulator
MDDRTVTGRVLAILDALAGADAPVALAELARITGIPKPTVRRIANDLVRRRMVDRQAGGYVFGPRMVALGVAAERQLCNADVVGPFVHDLQQRTGMIVWAGRMEGTKLLMVDSAHGRDHSGLMASHWPVRLDYELLPATATGLLMAVDNPEAMEQVLRRGLPRLTPRTQLLPGRYTARVRQVAESGIATEYDECRIGWWCGAMRLDPPHDKIIVSVTSEIARAPITRTLRQLQATCNGLGRELSAVGKTSGVSVVG